MTPPDKPYGDRAALDAAILAEYGKPGAAARIAARLGVTRNVVIGRAQRIGMAKPKSPRKKGVAHER